MSRESTQHKLDRVRAPRVQITYDVETGGAVEIRELPFVVGVMADFSGEIEAPLPTRKFIEINWDNFNDVMQGMGPRLVFEVDNKLGNDARKMRIELKFNTISDFEPEQVAAQIEPLSKLVHVRKQLIALLGKADSEDHLAEQPSRIINNTDLQQKIAEECMIDDETKKGLVTMASAADGAYVLDQIIDETKIGRDGWERDQASQQISTMIEEVMAGTLRVTKDLEATALTRIADIDRLLSAQLNIIIHTKEFKQLEASWRGLHYLVRQTETSSRLKIRAIHVSKDELGKDLEKAVDFNQSAIFKKVYEEEYGTFGGAPYGALIGGYEFGPNPIDIGLLQKMSNVAAASHAPFIASASPSLLNLERFTDISTPRDLANAFESPDYAEWRSFRESGDARYVGLTLPHILMRLPYGPDTNPVELFNFKESITDHSDYLWGNAAYALGTCLTNAFAKYGWCAAIRGVEGGGLIEGLPIHAFRTDDGKIALKCPAEIAITDRREKELSDLGFIPLIPIKDTDYAAFFSMQSCQKSKKYDSDKANAQARLTCQLQYILTTSRFAHYIKTMMRDRIGSFHSRSDCERFLNQWIRNYVVSSDEAETAYKARFPLRDALIDVTEVSGKPGLYRAVCFLRPHFQLDELSISLRMIVDIPPPAGT